MNNKILKDKDLWLIIITHLVFINSFAHGLLFGLLLIILFLTFVFICSLFNYNDRDTIFVFIVIFLLMLSYIIRFIALPTVYSYLEKNAKNTNIIKFINKIKSNYLWRIVILFISALIPFGIYHVTNISSKLILLLHLFLFSYFISYVTLFIWWDIQKIVCCISKQQLH